MFVYRIVKAKNRTTDLSGTGAYKTGGRWNSKGTYVLYTSENSSLAYLETLVHFDEAEFPSRLFLMKIVVDDKAPVYQLKDAAYPAGWMQLERLENKTFGDRFMTEKKFLGIRVKSASNTAEFNYLLNPLFPKFYDLIKVVDVIEINVDKRFSR